MTDCQRERDRQPDRETERETERERQRQRETDRQTARQTETETERQRDRERQRQRQRDRSLGPFAAVVVQLVHHGLMGDLLLQLAHSQACPKVSAAGNATATVEKINDSLT